MGKPTISIIIRTKNEERWIGHCLKSIEEQDFKDFEIILVDNQSTDHTVEVAKRFKLAKVLSIDKFKPGKALNEGIKVSSGKFLVFLSAHCIPETNKWLSLLLANYQSKDNIAGVYGRQLPLSFTDDIDKRDLLIVFGRDRRVQEKDFFFHNANSMIPREIWEKYPFDENVSNIEDRVWGKAVINNGYKIIYDPEAAVFHHHGLHQGNSPKRARGVVSVIESNNLGLPDELPKTMHPDQANIIAVIPISKDIEKSSTPYKLLSKLIIDLKSTNFINDIFLVSSNEQITIDLNTKWVNRELIKDSSNLGIEELLKFSLGFIESKSIFPDAILYANYEYPFRPENIFDEMITKSQYGGFETIFMGLERYNHYWHLDTAGNMAIVDKSLASNKKRDPIYEACYGLGCLTSSSIIRAGKLIGGSIGIMEIEDNPRFTLRYSKSDASNKLIENLMENKYE